jgi:hypothetical protein
VYRQYELDPREGTRAGALPRTFREIASNRSWRAYSTCG